MSRRGFTLVEVLVAITLTGLAVGVAVGVFQATAGSLRALETGSVDHARSMNGRIWLSDALMTIRRREDGRPAFQGGPSYMSFDGWFLTPGGWVEPGTARVAFEGGRLIASSPMGELTLGDSLASLTLEYLPTGGERSRWEASWSDAAPPMAVRMRLERAQWWDTLLFPVGVSR